MEGKSELEIVAVWLKKLRSESNVFLSTQAMKRLYGGYFKVIPSVVPNFSYGGFNFYLDCSMDNWGESLLTIRSLTFFMPNGAVISKDVKVDFTIDEIVKNI